MPNAVPGLTCPVCATQIGAGPCQICADCGAMVKGCRDPSCAVWNRAEGRFCRVCSSDLPSATEVASSIGVGGTEHNGRMQATSVRGPFRRLGAGVVPRRGGMPYTWVGGGQVCWSFEGASGFHAMNPHASGIVAPVLFPIHPTWSGALLHPPLVVGHDFVFAGRDQIVFWDLGNFGRVSEPGRHRATSISLDDAFLVHPPVRIGGDRIALLLQRGDDLLVRFLVCGSRELEPVVVSAELLLDDLCGMSGEALVSQPIEATPEHFYVARENLFVRVSFHLAGQENRQWDVSASSAGSLPKDDALVMAPVLYSFDHSLFVRGISSCAGDSRIPRVYHLFHWMPQNRWQVRELAGTEDPGQILALEGPGTPFLAVRTSAKIQLHSVLDPTISTTDEWGGVDLQCKEMTANGSFVVIRQLRRGAVSQGAYRTIQILDASGRTRTDQSEQTIPNLIVGAFNDGVGIGGLVIEGTNVTLAWRDLLGPAAG